MRADPPVRSRPGRRAAQAAAVFVLAVLVYLPSLRNGFAYDDIPIIVLNDRVTTFDVGGIAARGYWQDTTSALYRPLPTLTYAVDWHLSGGSPAWFHLVNSIWHGLVTLLLLVLLRRLAVPPTVALAAAAVFAVHPVHVEAVANTVGRAELMAAAFSIAAALLWTRPQRTLRRLPGLPLLALLLVLALFSKESAVALPGLLAVVDVMQRRLRPGRVGAWLRSRLLPLGMCAAMIAVFFVGRSFLPGGVTPDNLDPALEVLGSDTHRFMTALQAWPHYARLLFFPRVLLADYSPRIIMPAVAFEPAVLLGLVLLAVSLLGGVLAWKRGTACAAGALLWFTVAILPVSNLIVPIGVLVAERTLYLPSMALSFGLAAAAGPLTRRQLSARARGIIAVSAAAVLALLASRTVARVPDWKDTTTVFAALLRDRPDAFRGVWHFARIDAARSNHGVAAQRYADAVQLWPYRQRLVREAALHAVNTGDLRRALPLLAFALDRWSDDLLLRRVQAGVLLDMGELDAARYHIEQGLRFHPADSLLIHMMGDLTARRTGGAAR